MPVVARGDQFVFGQNLEDVAEFVGLQGMQSMQLLFERTTWHSAQHARQLAAVLERFGIQPNGRLTADDLAGLPLPERLWE